jgi:hypothetical protein
VNAEMEIRKSILVILGILLFFEVVGTLAILAGFYNVGIWRYSAFWYFFLLIFVAIISVASGISISKLGRLTRPWIIFHMVQVCPWSLKNITLYQRAKSGRSSTE